MLFLFTDNQLWMNYRQHDEAILQTSSDVTEALKRTSTLMQQELEKSAFSASMLGNI